MGAFVTLVNGIVSLFLFAWFIAGNVWVYSNYSKVQYDLTIGTSLASTYCDKTTYLFTFWTITVSYIITGLSCIIGVMICCCACVCGFAFFAAKK